MLAIRLGASSGRNSAMQKISELKMNIATKAVFLFYLVIFAWFVRLKPKVFFVLDAVRNGWGPCQFFKKKSLPNRGDFPSFSVPETQQENISSKPHQLSPKHIGNFGFPITFAVTMVTRANKEGDAPQRRHRQP